MKLRNARAAAQGFLDRWGAGTRDAVRDVADGVLRPVIHTTMPLAPADAAHSLMETSAHIGKILLTV